MLMVLLVRSFLHGLGSHRLLVVLVLIHVNSVAVFVKRGETSMPRLVTPSCVRLTSFLVFLVVLAVNNIPVCVCFGEASVLRLFVTFKASCFAWFLVVSYVAGKTRAASLLDLASRGGLCRRWLMVVLVLK